VQALVFGVDSGSTPPATDGDDTNPVLPAPDWRDAFTTIAEQHETGAIKVAFDFR